jgi:4-hydroxythreonine-4-phosphate dehydrogenase
MKSTKIRVGITHGDINSINYEIILNTFADIRMLEICTPVIYGSAKAAAYHKKILDLNHVNLNTIRVADEANNKKANLVNCVDDEIKVEIGKSTPLAGEAAYKALECAIADLKAGLIDVLVTAPINKFNIQSEKFQFKGHTDYLQNRFQAHDVLMFMVSDVLRVGLVTEHVPIENVSKLITSERINDKLNLMNRSLIEDFNIGKPKIAVLGLNPHAGDNGLLGKEEETIITPAIQKARDNGIMAFGPFPADGFFGSGSFKKFDAVLAMYHDQGLASFKTLSTGDGVNFTAGLPIVRTSPAHGTAYEIAGKGEASCDSFRSAIYMACDIYKNRETYKELVSNKLKPMASSLIEQDSQEIQ